MKSCFSVVKKDLLEIIREKVIIIIIIISIVTFPIINLLFSFDMDTSYRKPIKICIQESDIDVYDFINEFIDDTKNYRIDIIRTNESKKLLESGKIDFLIKNVNNDIYVIYNSSLLSSIITASKFLDDISKYYNELNQKKDVNTISFNLVNEKEKEDLTTSIENIISQIALIMLILQSSSFLANDLFAGEKERKTLELMLSCGVKREKIFFGKLLTLLFLTIFSNLISYLTYIIFNSSYNNILFEIIVIIILTCISSITSLSVSLFSKSIRSSQIINEIISAIPIGALFMFNYGLLKLPKDIVNIIPIINVCCTFNDILSDIFNIKTIIISLVLSVIIIFVLIIIDLKYIKSEKILN